MDLPVSEGSAVSQLSTWRALCKDCRNRQLAKPAVRRRKGDARQEEFEYSEMSATRAIERGQTRSDRCPECRRLHRREISAFPVAYVDITAIGEAATYVTDPDVGPTGPLGGLGPLPSTHTRRTESVDLGSFALGLSDRDILDLIETMSSHQVVVLEAGTGTGKSTLAPFRLMNPPDGAAYRPGDVGPIIVTEPRVPATKEIAKFVGEAMCFGHDPRECVRHVGPGYPVGYQCEGIKVWDEACSLIYVTDGTMINWILNGDLARMSTVIVDEAHERSENIDLILTLLAAHLPRYPHLRVVIASATIDPTYFMQFFAATPTVTVGHVSIAAAKSIGYGVPLFSDVDFTEEVLADGLTAADPTNADASPRFSLPGWSINPLGEKGGRSLRDITRDTMLDLRAPASNWPEQIDMAGAQQVMRILDGTDEGDVLVFMPSQATVLRTRDLVASMLEDYHWGETVDLYWMMAAAPDDQKRGALGETAPGRRKVVVASNLAETSLTIAGIRYVVDSGLVVQGQWDPALALKYTRTHPHSQSGVRQRWGRVGRKTHGWVFPLYSLAQYHTLPRDSPAGSTQTNLEGSMLKVLAAGEDPERLHFPADFEAEGSVRDRFAQQSATVFREERRRAMTALRASGAIDADGKGLTRLGSELVRSRLPPEQAIALMFADRLACVPEVAMALVVFQSGRLYGRSGILASDERWPSAWNVHARQCHEALAQGCLDDLDLLIRIFADWAAAADPERWCRQWWVNETALLSARADSSKVIESLAPGMSREATRALEPRLATRARAALTRSLPGLRFVKAADGLWRPPASPDARAVSVSPMHLVAPPDDLVALGRERAPERGWIAGAGSVLGLVAWQDWASDGEPDDFDLLRRVSRRTDDGAIGDPARLLRGRFTVGATLRVTPGGETEPPSIEKVTDGLEMPAAVTETIDDPAKATGSSVVYSTETRPQDADPVDLEEIVGADPLVEVDLVGEIEVVKSAVDQTFPEEVASAAAEVPEEEFRLTPIPIVELENADLEELAHAEDVRHDAATSAFAAFVDSPTLSVRGPEPDWDAPWDAIVVGYDLTNGTPTLVVEAVVGDTDDWPEVGALVSVVAGELAMTHFARGRVFRQVDDTGALARVPKHLVFDSLIDQRVGSDPDAVPEGSVWSARMLPGRSGRDSARISLTEDAARRLGGNPGTGATPICALGVARYRDWYGREYVAAEVEVEEDTAGGFSPTLLIPATRLEESGIAATPGIRVRVALRNDITAREGGIWPVDVLEAALELSPERFGKGRKRGQFRLAGLSPLTDAERDSLIALDPSSAAVERNAWLLWDSGRRLTVMSASVVAEADVPAADVRRIRTDLATALRKTHRVSLTVSPAGRLVVSGSSDNVRAALSDLEETLSRPRIVLQIPLNAAGRYPSYPEVRTVLTASGPSSVKYEQRTGRASIPANSEDVDALIKAMDAAFAWVDGQFLFAEFPGFLAFQKKANWETISATFPGIQRSVAEGGRSWRILAADSAQLDLVAERTRAVIPKSAFTVTALQSTTQQIAGSARIDTVKVSYVTPTAQDAATFEERATWVKSTAAGRSFLVTLAADGRGLTERGSFDPDSWAGETSGAAWTIGDYSMKFASEPASVALAVERGPEGEADVATVRLADLEDGRARAVKAVEGAGVMLIAEADDGELYEARLLDLARSGEEWWSVTVDAGDEHIVVSSGGYVSVNSRDSDEYWSGEELPPGGGEARRTWLWLNAAMSERLGVLHARSSQLNPMA